MPLLPPWFLNTVVAIGQAIDAQGGVAANATGTLVGWPTSKTQEDEQLYRVFLVTNRHVVEDQPGFLVRFNQGAAAQWYQVDLIDDDGSPLWHGHGDPQCDIAAVSINVDLLRDAGAEFRFLSADKIWAYQSQREELGISAGDGVFVLGFLSVLQGRKSPMSSCAVEWWRDGTMRSLARRNHFLSMPTFSRGIVAGPSLCVHPQ